MDMTVVFFINNWKYNDKINSDTFDVSLFLVNCLISIDSCVVFTINGPNLINTSLVRWIDIP